MAKKKILYIHCGGETVGGIETYLAHVVKAHKNCDAYLGIVKAGEYSRYLKWQKTPNVILLNGGRLREIAKVGIAVRTATRFVRNNNIEFVIGKGNNSWVYAAIIARLARIRSIFYVANDINPQYWKSPITLLAGCMKPWLYVANSEFTAKSIAEVLGQESSIVYPAANVDKFVGIDNKNARESLCKEFAISPQKFIYTIVGRLQEWKGQHIAIEAFKKMRNKKNAVLLVVGDYTHANDQPFFRRLQQLAAAESVIFTGFRKDIPQIITASDVVVHASITPEPFGITVVEGMLAKKSVIASQAGGPLEIIDHGENGLLVPVKDVCKLSQTMDMLFENRDLGFTLGEKAYEKAKCEFSVEASARLMEKAIRAHDGAVR
ncbi:glycosyltransferase family 4 protein [Candidatus Uabimicrobium amorphum]|uniref:Putative glycosyl transferase n=1 Tax=Uabimicrobium amorphum TaxID=2596890 RepID=A0A5S9INX2_UABAM|nr:glycosyltransferase family 4 protein [Candidatus Uabimicrobium amorphum]BBM84916.1 putative glycosyl transferase [Candidatus Uabimicrobium amorphum]